MARLNKKTVEEVLNLADAIMNELTEDPENGVKIQLSITSGNSKIGKTLNVSTMPGLTCRNCGECIYTCYAMRSAAFHRETCIRAWTKNAALLALNRDEYFHQIDVKMNRRKKINSSVGTSPEIFRITIIFAAWLKTPRIIRIL